MSKCHNVNIKIDIHTHTVLATTNYCNKASCLSRNSRGCLFSPSHVCRIILSQSFSLLETHIANVTSSEINSPYQETQVAIIKDCYTYRSNDVTTPLSHFKLLLLLVLQHEGHLLPPAAISKVLPLGSQLRLK